MEACNGKSHVHFPKVIGEDINGIRVLCEHCHKTYIIRKDPIKGNPEIKQYAKIYKKDILQGNDNLFYKYHPEYLSK